MSLTFVIPVRHHESVPNWPDVQRRLAMTAASVAGQIGGDWRCVVVANRSTRCLHCRTGSDRARRPAIDDSPRLGRWGGEQARNDAVREDKGARVLAGIVAARPAGHVMVWTTTTSFRAGWCS